MKLWCVQCIRRAVEQGVDVTALRFYEGGSDNTKELYTGHGGQKIKRGVTIAYGDLVCWEHI